MDLVQFILLFLAALGSALAAFFTWFSSNATMKSSKGATLLHCLNNYFTVMRDKKNASDTENVILAEEFYRELFDIYWSEFYVWLQSVIPNEVMLSWLFIRKANFDNDQIRCKTADGEIKIVTYREQWEKLARTGKYFNVNDPFREFTDLVHDGKISNLDQLKSFKKKFCKRSY